ncbi:hypothetical protein GCM10019016_113370 [Streptomyces prasinosporus]|uniref:Uncharacterized protein n=1 Tax=Streptomyces prasinosporus TaxID=68256 RepID=A0ABP6U9T6_9ACTN|nr:hypothetical protein GCM10010332_25350 [Streptomyces albogriseolus]
MPTPRSTPARGIRTALMLTVPQARGASDGPVTAQAAYLAERLRENPVHATGQLRNVRAGTLCKVAPHGPGCHPPPPRP